MDNNYKKYNEIIHDIYIKCADDVDMICNKFENFNEISAKIGGIPAHSYMIDYINKENRRIAKKGINNIYEIGFGSSAIGTLLFTKYHLDQFLTMNKFKSDIILYVTMIGCGLYVLYSGYQLCEKMISLINLKYQKTRLWWNEKLIR